tara:strand:- start:6371 stop:7318 length:948 start_codon:yes stop_codon:yes gene_type:complete
MNVEGMNILVTGCAGFIGSHMVDLLLEKGHTVIGVDCFTYAGSAGNIQHNYDNDKFKLYNNDIRSTHSIGELCDLRNIDWIINFAAETHVDNSINSIIPFLKSNVEGVASLLNVCKDLPEIKMLHISTDEVYGSAHAGSFSEEDKLNPRNPYSASKAAAEHLVTSYHNTYNTTFKMVRMSNNFGPRQHAEKLIPTVVNCILSNRPVPIYGDGTNVRDWFYVKDCVRMIYDVLDKGKYNETYNLSHNQEVNNLVVVQKICEIMGVDASSVITFVKDRPGHDFRYSISNEKIKALGISSPSDFTQSLQCTIDAIIGR